ncbi:MAG: tetratricopeptide repeat protein [Candidatus Thiodiazotropha sp.]
MPDLEIVGNMPLFAVQDLIILLLSTNMNIGKWMKFRVKLKQNREVSSFCVPSPNVTCRQIARLFSCSLPSILQLAFDRENQVKYLVLVFALTLSGCVSTLNERHAHKYANAAVAAEKAGNWDMSRRYWARAAVNARLAGMTEKQQAIAYYEYGRSCGVTCFYEESQKYLLKSLELDKASGGPVHMALLELARLNLDQAKYEEANRFFEQLPNLYSEVNAEEADPAGVALVYEEFSRSLENVGRGVEAQKYQELSKQLREKGQGRESNTERTPYGQHCSES